MKNSSFNVVIIVLTNLLLGILLLCAFVFEHTRSTTPKQDYTFEVIGYIEPTSAPLTPSKSSILESDKSLSSLPSTDETEPSLLEPTLSDTMSAIQEEVEEMDYAESLRECAVEIVDNALLKIDNCEAYQETTLENKRVFASRVLYYLETQGLITKIEYDKESDTLMFEYANESKGCFKIK